MRKTKPTKLSWYAARCHFRSEVAFYGSELFVSLTPTRLPVSVGTYCGATDRLGEQTREPLYAIRLSPASAEGLPQS